MNDPWKVPPESLNQRVSDYVKKAGKLEIPEDRLRKYARILIAAEEVLKHRDGLDREARDITALVAASEHGFDTNDPGEARAAYAAARKAQQELHASSSGCAKRLEKLRELIETRHRRLRIGVASKFPIQDLAAAIELLQAFASATAPGRNLTDFKMAKSELSQTALGHSLMWWRIYIPRFRGQWVEMHELARRWRLTDAKNVETFKRLARKFKPVRAPEGMLSALRCPPWALG
jgi:hypothetical protein